MKRPIARPVPGIIDRNKENHLALAPRGYPFVMDHGRGVEVIGIAKPGFDFAAGIAVSH